MSYALDRAASYLSQDLRKYNIEVPFMKRIIIRRSQVIQVDTLTTYAKCLALLRAEIRKEKKIEEDKQMENQGSLFE